MRKHIFFIIAVILSSSVILSNDAKARDYEKRIEKSFNVKNGGTLILDSDRGSVEIRSHASEKVDIVVEMAADTRSKERAEDWFDRFVLSFDHRGKDVEIRGEWEDSWFRRDNRLKIHYDIRVPKKYNLNIETAGGSIRVDDLIGDVDLKTSGGSVSMGNIEGPVWAKTSGGSISLESAKGEVNLHTSGGGITLGEIDGPVDARTSGGTISADGVNGDLEARTSGGSLRLRKINGNLQATTSGGSIYAELLKQIDTRSELKTSGGSIRLQIPPNFKADIDASTSGGRVITDIPLTIQGTFSKNQIRGKINGGGRLISLRTSGGNIEIRER